MCLIFFPLPLHKADKKRPHAIILFFSNLPANIQGPDIRNNVFYEGAMFFLESESSAAFSLSLTIPLSSMGDFLPRLRTSDSASLSLVKQMPPI